MFFFFPFLSSFLPNFSVDTNRFEVSIWEEGEFGYDKKVYEKIKFLKINKGKNIWYCEEENWSDVEN